MGSMADEVPRLSATEMLNSIISMIREDCGDRPDEYESCIDFGVHTIDGSESGAGGILQDICFLRREIVNAREDILIDKLESLQKQNNGLEESLYEAMQTIRQLSRNLESPNRFTSNSAVLSIPFENAKKIRHSDECDRDDDEISQQMTSRAEVHGDSVQGDSGEIHTNGLDKDHSKPSMETSATSELCFTPDSDFQCSKDDKILFLLKVCFSILTTLPFKCHHQSMMFEVLDIRSFQEMERLIHQKQDALDDLEQVRVIKRCRDRFSPHSPGFK
jgi:plasmid stability protein